jgi:hypothetical protein
MTFMPAGRLTDLREKSTRPIRCHQSSLAKIGAGTPLLFLLSNVRNKFDLQKRHSLCGEFAGIICESIRDRTIASYLYHATILLNKLSADDAQGNQIESQGVFADRTEFSEPRRDFAGLVQWCFWFSGACSRSY